MFHRDAPLAFDESYPYGRRDKVELLWRLGVAGAWDGWRDDPWDPPRPPPRVAKGRARSGRLGHPSAVGPFRIRRRPDRRPRPRAGSRGSDPPLPRRSRRTCPLRAASRAMRFSALLGKRLRAPGRRVRTWATLNRRAARLIARSGLFDEQWYLARYPDVARRGYPALVHYLRWGAAQSRDPNPLFQTEWYRRAPSGTERDGPRSPRPLHSAGGSTPPSPGFDPAWYRGENADLAGREPLAAYFAEGRAAGRAPRPPLSDFSRPDVSVAGAQPWRIAIKIPAPSRSRMNGASSISPNSLRAALERLGHLVAIDFRDGWYARPPVSDDLVIVLRGALAYRPNRTHFNLLWMISHPESITPDECAAYDLVAVASTLHAERLRRTLRTPVKVLLQATDPSRFHPVAESQRRAGGVTFVGNSRGEYRPIVRAAIEAGLQPQIYGAGWQGMVPPELIKAAAVDNRQLAPLYAGARAVLNDHWPSMRAAGFISNRVYDVLASGGALVSDAVDGIAELFGPLVEQVGDMSGLPGAVARSAGVSPEQRWRQPAWSRNATASTSGHGNWPGSSPSWRPSRDGGREGWRPRQPRELRHVPVRWGGRPPDEGGNRAGLLDRDPRLQCGAVSRRDHRERPRTAVRRYRSKS